MADSQRQAQASREQTQEQRRVPQDIRRIQELQTRHAVSAAACTSNRTFGVILENGMLIPSELKTYFCTYFPGLETVKHFYGT